MKPPGLSLSHAAMVWIVSAAMASAGESGPAVPLPQAHAHNDYYHRRPLLDALEHGFCSVEVDVFLVDGRLLVGHGRRELKSDRTLQSLYLDPLRKRVAENGGRVHRGGPTFTLLIDVKSDAEETYATLGRVLRGYADILTQVNDGRPRPGAVTAIVSGNRATAAMAAEAVRFAALDGRLSDLGSDLPGHLMPLISDRWSTHFAWRGEGPMPQAQRKKLRAIVQKAHAAGRRVRFWATPENTAVWKELAAAGVDLINTDDLDGLRRFLRQLHPPR